MASAAPARQALGLDVREHANATPTVPKSVLPASETPLEELELLDELERLATANDDGTETWLRTLLKILCGELPLSPLALA